MRGMKPSHSRPPHDTNLCPGNRVRYTGKSRVSYGMNLRHIIKIFFDAIAKVFGYEIIRSDELRGLRIARSQLIDIENGLKAGPGGDWDEVNLFNLLPPPSLIARVCGADEDGKSYPDFLASGHQIVHNLKTVLSHDGIFLADFEDILDFGCGCARVIRFLRYEGAKAWPRGCDIDPEAIEWCQRHYDILGAEFHLSPYEPPTNFKDGQFDFIYADIPQMTSN